MNREVIKKKVKTVSVENAHESLIARGAAEIIDRESLLKKLSSGKPLRVKFGVDPSKPELHIGHTVPLRKLREFQDLGHTAIMLFGDYTAQLGDPSDRSEVRKLLSSEETRRNADSYLKQVFTILDEKKTEVRYNSEWLGQFNLRDVIELMAAATVNHLLSHETFGKRIREGQPLFTHEILYPLLQGYDSVMLKADVELGATDQKFNMLMGRVLQRQHNQPEQDVVLMRYLPGTDGQEKMSKSLGNTINLTDSPEDMFGKVMSIPDDVMPTYYELMTDSDVADVQRLRDELASGHAHPRDKKIELGKAVVNQFYSYEQAEAAAEAFERVFRGGQVPEDIEILKLKPVEHELMDILVSRSGLVESKSAARRLVSQGGVKVNKETVHDIQMVISPSLGDQVVIQVGPRRFVKVIWSSS